MVCKQLRYNYTGNLLIFSNFRVSSEWWSPMSAEGDVRDARIARILDRDYPRQLLEGNFAISKQENASTFLLPTLRLLEAAYQFTGFSIHFLYKVPTQFYKIYIKRFSSSWELSSCSPLANCDSLRQGKTLPSNFGVNWNSS